jgi:hypothetical protein
MVSIASAYSILIKGRDFHASRKEESKKEGYNFSVVHEISLKWLHIFHMFLVS